MRTEDLEYGPDYWQSLDNGAGYQDSVVWEDLAHVLMETFARPDLRMLDVGAAAGFLVHHMRRRGVESFGYDYSRTAIDLGPDVIRPFMREYDLTVPSSMQYMPGVPFNLVVSLETLEHIPEEHVQTALANIKQAISADGLAFLSICLEDVPNWDSDPTHITIKSRDWWSAHLHLAGFEEHPSTVRELRRYKMFAQHNGLFVVTK